MASLALVAAAYILLGIQMARYYTRKLAKFNNTYILSHRSDSYLFRVMLFCLFLVICTS